MSPPADPYRTLGLHRGASLADVKQAYRALAKVHHPDAAGAGALPRFLAIQAAYEQLTGGPAAKSSTARAADRAAGRAQRPSEADPDRADATHRAYGGRTRRTRPGPSAAGEATGGSAPNTGATGGRARSRSDAPPRRDRAGGRRSDEAEGPAAKATLGSTSYDGADQTPFEPDWAGASWYGTTSGTYWTINPKEYADPRKHGPEYQARARRAARGKTRAGEAVADGPPRADQDAGEADEVGPPPRNGEPAGNAGPMHATSPRWEPGPAAASVGAARTAPATEVRPRPRPSTGLGSRSAASAETPPDIGAAATELGRALTDERAAHGRWRFVQAVVGWLPLAFGLGWLIGELTGCGRFAASCDGAGPMLTPILAAIALVVLVVAPRIAALAAAAAVGLVVAAVPTALVLSAGGEAVDGASRTSALGAVLAIAWLAGLAFAVARRLRSAPRPTQPPGPVS